ncbi:MAG: hypothetical protein HRU29_06885 [Rhizobiales bacterium]|nr:hypothetical protein [Hyphomicrobiales bacterium]NRB14110.1 hypothetical protein [Hyphomicrobiales bacterium]
MGVRKSLIGFFIGLGLVVFGAAAVAEERIFTENTENSSSTTVFSGSENEHAQAVLTIALWALQNNNPEAYEALVQEISNLNPDYADMLKLGLGIYIDKFEGENILILGCEYNQGHGSFPDKKTGIMVDSFESIFRCVAPK